MFQSYHKSFYSTKESTDPCKLAPLVKQGGILSFWVTNNNQEFTNNNNENSNNKQDTEGGAPRKGGGRGPTTEAGRQKLREEVAAKQAKKDRRQAKNRQKRQAYRERKRENKYASDSKGRSSWGKPSSSSKKKNKPKETSSSSSSRRGSKKTDKNEKEHQRMMRHAKRGDREAWDALLATALTGQDFILLVQLFAWELQRPQHAENGANRRRAVRQRFRSLATVYHPDKHHGDVECYKVAFQALNEAHATVQRAMVEA